MTVRIAKGVKKTKTFYLKTFPVVHQCHTVQMMSKKKFSPKNRSKREFLFEHTATNDILCFLRYLRPDVPKDDRTLLGTIRKKSDINFEHFGLNLGMVKNI